MRDVANVTDTTVEYGDAALDDTAVGLLPGLADRRRALVTFFVLLGEATGGVGPLAAESLGCALGAVSYLAHGAWEAHPAAPGEADWFAGRFHFDRLRDDILTRQGALGLRATHRDDLLRTPVDRTTAKRIELICAISSASRERPGTSRAPWRVRLCRAGGGPLIGPADGPGQGAKAA